jgi:16S rRNA (guanine527-N7)-methyltransferase
MAASQSGRGQPPRRGAASSASPSPSISRAIGNGSRGGQGVASAAIDRSLLRCRLDQGLADMDPLIARALDQHGRDRLIGFLALLARWNRAYNLTAVRDPLEMVSRHLLDSLAVLPWVTAGPVLDAGTGAGLPGLPLAVARPDIGFTLLDGNGKKARFVRQAVLELGLSNVEVVHSRLQAYRPGPKFVTITARALASLSDLIANCQHLAAARSRLLALKGRLPELELAALAQSATASPAIANSASGEAMRAAVAIHALRVPFLDGERNLIEIPFFPNAHG